MYGYTKKYDWHPSDTIQTWEISDSHDGGVPTCRECGGKTEIYSTGDNSTVVCTRCNISAKLNTQNLNYYLAQSHRVTFPIHPRRKW